MRCVVLVALLVGTGCADLLGIDPGQARRGGGGGVPSGGAGGQPPGQGGGGAGGAGGGIVDPNCPGTYPEEVMADDPLGYWRLNETGCTVMCPVVDVVSEQVAWATTGEMGTDPFTLGVPGALPDDPAILLNRPHRGIIDFDEVYDFGTTTPFSLEMWVYINTQYDSGGFIGRDGALCDPGNRPGYRVEYLNDGHVRFRIEECSGPSAEVNTVEEPEPFVWHHVVATFDGASLRLYVDGALVGENTPTPLPAFMAPQRSLVAGGRGGGTYNNFDGRVDEIAIYDDALPLERVVCHHGKAPAR